LSNLLGEMVSTNDPSALREIVSTLVKATEDTRGINTQLEKGLRTARAEVDELRKVLEDTRTEALKDALTGISNRKHFEQSLLAAIESATSTRRPFALLMVDIDHFKEINDALGHPSGDTVLQANAEGEELTEVAIVCVRDPGGEQMAEDESDAAEEADAESAPSKLGEDARNADAAEEAVSVKVAVTVMVFVTVPEPSAVGLEEAQGVLAQVREGVERTHDSPRLLRVMETCTSSTRRGSMNLVLLPRGTRCVQKRRQTVLSCKSTVQTGPRGFSSKSRRVRSATLFFR
jgi:diguanylate cyclase